MKFGSIILACVVVFSIFMWVLQRDRVLEWAGVAEEPAPVSATAEPAAAETEAPAEESVPGRVAVVAVTSTARTVDSAVLLRGETQAARNVDVKAETAGLVISEPLRKGQFVEAGQLLCELDVGTREAALAEAEARFKEAELSDRAAARLATEGFASETRAASAAATLQAAMAGVEAAQTELDRLKITAPFSGLLESDTAELGALLRAGDPCAAVIRLDPIKLVGFVPETAVNRVQLGAQAGARLVSGREVAGEVTFVSRSSDPATRTFAVEVTVPNEDRSIRDGQTAEIAIAAEGAAAHLLPSSALTLNDEGELGVRVAVDGITRFMPVSILRDTPNGIWLGGLPEKVDVIVVGQEFVRDGVPIAVTYRETTQ
ncbi:MAG: efflux RND transporter periplasmic adaptor subunit [Pseudomonadota bacterium]